MSSSRSSASFFHGHAVVSTALFVLLGLTGCAAPAAPAAPERMVGVLGSAAQARPLPETKGTLFASAEPEAPRAAAPVPSAGAQIDTQAGLRAAEDAYARSDWVAAAREFKLLTITYPRNGQVWFGLGASSALAGQLDEASAAFEMALRIDPRDARVAYNLSLIRLSQAEMALGVASANSAAATAPVQQEIARLTRELGPVFRRSGDPAPVASSADTFRMQDPARAAAQGPNAPASPVGALIGTSAINPPGTIR